MLLSNWWLPRMDVTNGVWLRFNPALDERIHFSPCMRKMSARSARGPKKRGQFRQKRASFCLGIQKTWQLKVVVCLCPCFQFSLILVFFCWSLDDRLLKIWPRVWKTWHRKQATDSHRQPYAATGSHKPRKIIKSGLLMGPGCQDAAPKPTHL